MTTYINPGNNTGLYGINDININTPYGNANVESFLATGSDTGGNVVGNIVASGNISGGNISASGNVTADFYIGDGSQLTNLPAGDYSNANVSAFLAAYGSNTVVTTGNITGGNFIGSGAALTSLTGANVTGTVPLATSATTAGTVTTAAQPNITSVGTLTSLAVTGNISGNYYIGNGSLLTGITGSGTYSNSNVASFMAAFGSNTISTTGNITGGNFVGSGAALTSITGANVSGTVANATYATSAGSATTATTATSATTAGTVTTAAQGNITSVGTLTSLAVTGNITGGNLVTAGNVTGAYIKGDGSQLTNISVAAGSKIQNGTSEVNIATSGGNIDFTAGAYTNAMKVLSGNGAVTITNELIVDGDIRAISNGIVSAQGNVTGANLITGGLVTSTGNITGGNLVTGGQVSATGNITGGNISGVSNVAAVNGNFTNVYTGGMTTLGTVDVGGELDVAGNISAPLSQISGGNLVATGTGRGFISATANISAGGNIISSGYITASGNITSTGNIAASYFVGNGSLLTGITTTYGNSNVAAFLPTYTGDLAGDDLFLNTATGNAYIQASSIGTSVLSATGYVLVGTNPGGNAAGINSTGYITGNTLTGNLAVNSSATMSAVGNITGGNLVTAGNVTGTYIKGNGSLLTGIPATAAGGSPTQVQYSRSDSTFGGIAYMTYNDSNGNIAMQNTLLNTGNVITTVQPFNDSVVSATVNNPGRIMFGTGYSNTYNSTTNYDPFNWNRGSLVLISQNIAKGDNGRRTTALNVDFPVELTANIANSSTRLSGGRQQLQIGGGANVYGMTSTNINGWPNGLQTGIWAGDNGNVVVGNVTLVGATAVNATMDTAGTSNIATGVGIRSQFTGSIGNVTCLFPQVSLNSPGGNVSIVFNQASNHNTNARSSTNYYFLNNTDDVAQNKLGSLLRYTEFNYTGAGTSGSITISKNNGQVQQINLAGNITSMGFADFVSSASDGTNTDEQSDTVTLIFNQGSTGGYTVLFPVGSEFKYAGNVTALQSTAANSVSLVSVSAIRLSGTTTYLITISPGFV